MADDRVLDRVRGLLAKAEATTFPAEAEVFTAIARGMSNAEISQALYLSESTVKTHVGRILMKLDLRDRIHAVVLGYETGVVRPGGADGPAPG